MISPVRANLIWEDTPDTPLNAYNLSKTIDIQSESKFIHFVDDAETTAEADYRAWANLIIYDNNFEPYKRAEYVGQIIYDYNNHTCKIIVDNHDGTYLANDYKNPYKRLLKIKAKTKITMDFEKDDVYFYNSFDVGSTDRVFSAEHLLTEPEFAADTVYMIYLYYHISYGDYAQIKIMSAMEEAVGDWKTTAVDNSSPSGFKLISYRKIGGFKTDNQKFILKDSVWDLSTYRNEIVVESYKKSDNGNIRLLDASDIPITDEAEILNSETVESALEEIKLKSDQLDEDLYTANRFGVELKYSFLKKAQDNSLIPCVTNDLTLKITAGYIDVYGYRVSIPNDIYLASTSGIRINDDTPPDPPQITYLGAQAVNVVYDNSIGGEGTIWRLFVDLSGNLYLKDNAHAYAKYICQGKLKGWYDISTGMRCIGKFRVRRSGSVFIEKLSVVNTFEIEAAVNSLWVFHSTIAPDGLIACDGKWHDINGYDQNSYDAMPATNLWQGGSWYEETPNFWNRTFKMPAQDEFQIGPFTLDSNRMVTGGGSAECGAEPPLSTATHTHTIDHTHTPGSLHITESGVHQNTVQFTGVVSQTVQVTPVPLGTKVTTDTHNHSIVIGGGGHIHEAAKFSGTVAAIANYESGQTSSWPPYKEVLICIKK